MSAAKRKPAKPAPKAKTAKAKTLSGSKVRATFKGKEIRPVTISRRPEKGDKSDKRCAFVADGCLGEDEDVQVTADNWCHGCSFYVCEPCSVNFSLMGRHDVMEHRDDPDDR